MEEILKLARSLEDSGLILEGASSYHVTCGFQSESALYSCLNVKELLARSRCKI